MREACVHENHHEERRVVMAGVLHATWYGYSNNGRQSFVIAAHDRHNGFDSDACFPIEGVFFEHHNRTYTFDAHIQFWNQKREIGNPVIFEVPKICKRPF